MSDHDQRFKNLLREFFAAFFELFFPQWAARFDFSRVEWLEQEVFSDPPQGKRRSVDLVAKLPTRQAVPGPPPDQEEKWVALIHVEIEHRDTVAPLRPRVFSYYVGLRQRHDLPVLPVALYLRVGLEGIGIDVYEEHFWELRPVRFEYLYVGLPALDGLQYVQGNNWLGVALAALMRIPEERKVWLRAEALRRIMGSPHNDYQRFLLGECVQAYLPLDAERQREFERLLATEPYQGVQAMATTWYEQGLEQGLEQGQRQLRELLRTLLEQRFGPLSTRAQERLASWPGDRLVELGRSLLTAQSLQELGLNE
jgi:hypothetical protein